MSDILSSERSITPYVKQENQLSNELQRCVNKRIDELEATVDKQHNEIERWKEIVMGKEDEEARLLKDNERLLTENEVLTEELDDLKSQLYKDQEAAILALERVNNYTRRNEKVQRDLSFDIGSSFSFWS